MKVTSRQMRKIIREELLKLTEGANDDAFHDALQAYFDSLRAEGLDKQESIDAILQSVEDYFYVYPE